MNKGRRRRTENLEVSLTPLIDTVLVLLVVFMLASGTAQHAYRVALPTSGRQEYKDEKNDFFVAVDQYGVYYLPGNKPVLYEELVSELEQHARIHKGSALVIFADREAVCGPILECMSLASELGISHVYCKTRPR